MFDSQLFILTRLVILSVSSKPLPRRGGCISIAFLMNLSSVPCLPPLLSENVGYRTPNGSHQRRVIVITMTTIVFLITMSLPVSGILMTTKS